MTKPADGQIAKARELRYRAEKEYIKQFGYGAQKGIPDLMARFAESERQAVKEECCRAVCRQCAESFFWAAATKRGDKWIHSCLNIPGVAPCHAAAIRSMGE